MKKFYNLLTAVLAFCANNTFSSNQEPEQTSRIEQRKEIFKKKIGTSNPFGNLFHSKGSDTTTDHNFLKTRKVQFSLPENANQNNSSNINNLSTGQELTQTTTTINQAYNKSDYISDAHQEYLQRCKKNKETIERDIARHGNSIALRMKNLSGPGVIQPLRENFAKFDKLLEIRKRESEQNNNSKQSSFTQKTQEIFFDHSKFNQRYNYYEVTNYLLPKALQEQRSSSNALTYRQNNPVFSSNDTDQVSTQPDTVGYNQQSFVHNRLIPKDQRTNNNNWTTTVHNKQQKYASSSNKQFNDDNDDNIYQNRSNNLSTSNISTNQEHPTLQSSNESNSKNQSPHTLS